jgi:hypothetical protein
MSALIEIREKLQDTEAAMARAERSLAQNPNSPTAALTIESIFKRKEQLVKEFSEIAKETALDVCSFRIFSENNDTIKIVSFANALYNFQTLFTTVVDAIKNGPKERAKPDAATIAQTAFDFGYCFSGSAGIVMTMPDELMLFGENDFETSIIAIFEMANASKSEQIAHFAKRLGIASIRKLYRWTHDQLQAGTGADIQWIKGSETKFKLFIQVPQLETLKTVIDETSDEKEDIVELAGQLVGLDVDTKKFHMKIEGGDDIKGDVAPIIGTKHTLELPKRYTADVLVKRKIYYATEKEDVSYFLLKLK